MRKAIVVAAERNVRPLGLQGDFESNLMAASKLGYDGVELIPKDPDKLDSENVKSLTGKSDLSIPL